MIFDSFYNSNPNLRLKILRDLIIKFRGYITGAEIDNTFSVFGSSTIQGQISDLAGNKGFTELVDKFKNQDSITDIERQIIEKWMSGTYGSYTTHDLLCNPSIYTGIPLNPLTEYNKDILAEGGLIDALAVICDVDSTAKNFPDVRVSDGKQERRYWTMADMCHHYEVSSNVRLTKSFFDKQEKHIKEAIVEDFNNAEQGLEEYKKSKEVKSKEDKTPDIDLFILEGDSVYEYQYVDQKWYARKKGKQSWTDISKDNEAVKKLDGAYREQLNNSPSSSLSSESEINNQEKYTIQTFSAFLENNDQRMPHYAATKKTKVEAAINPKTKPLEPGTTYYKFPNMSSFVFRKPIHNKGSRNDNYLSIFFGAISQLELSRCTPYLSLTFYTKQNINATNLNKLDPIGFMRFEDGMNGTFTTLPDIEGVFGSKINNFSGENEAITSVNYMDMFLSPQTMVNANINNNSVKNFSDLLDGAINNNEVIEDLNNVLDPFAPLLSLKSFNATINSGGNFMITNRRAKLSISLHDRSRLNEVAPFVSLSQLSRTLVKIEHGWSHPDGDLVRSENDIGKFLNSLRESHVYMLTSSDFSFNGNQVDINMTLDFWGGTDFKSVHVAEGNYKDAKKLKSKIIDVINNLERTNILKSKKHGEGFALQRAPSLDSLDPKGDQQAIDEGNKRILKHVEIIRNSVDAVKILLPTTFILSINQMIDKYSLQDNKEQVESYWHAEILMEYFLALSKSKLIDIGEDEDGTDIKSLLEDKDPTSLITLLDSANTSFIESIKSLEIRAKKNLAERLVSKVESMTNSKIQKRKDGGFDRILDTPDPFTSQLCHVYYNTENIDDEKELGGVGRSESYPAGHISLGKIIANLIALPISTDQNYDEIQILFYPLNNFSAGARKYTTASLPVEIKAFKKEIYKVIETDGDCTPRGIFDIISNYFQNNNLAIYGLSNSAHGSNTAESEKEIRKETNFKSNAYEKFRTIKGKFPANEKEKEAAEKIYVKSRLSSLRTNSLKSDLEKIYNSDGLGLSNTTYFKKPVIHLEIETMPMIVPAPSKAANAGDLMKRATDAFNSAFNPSDKDILIAKGIDESKKILKIHVYDENATSRPAETMFMDGLVAPETFFPTAGLAKTATDKGILDDAAIKKFKDAANAYISKMSIREIKQFVSRAFPTIRHGSQQSVVKSINVTSNTTDEIVNARLMNALKNEQERTEGSISKKTANFQLMEEFIIPTSIDMAIYGCPFITMGLNVFVDMNTGTDIDNVYMVGDVTHNISAGEYSTNISLYLPQVGTGRDMRSRLEGAIELIDKEKLEKAAAEVKRRLEEKHAAQQRISDLIDRRAAANLNPTEPGTPAPSLTADPFGGPGEVEGLGSIYSPD